MADHTHPRRDHPLRFGAGSSRRRLHRLPVTGHTGPLVQGLLDRHGYDTLSCRLGERGAMDRRVSVCLLGGPGIKRDAASRPACHPGQLTMVTGRPGFQRGDQRHEPLPRPDLTRHAYGYHSAEALIAMATPTRGGLCPPLPGRS